MSEREEFQSTDPESRENQAAYHDLLESIERRMDPSSNTVLVVDDSRMVRKMVARGIQEMDDHVVIFEAGDGWPGFHCKHAHCADRTIRDVISLWPDADDFCARAFERRARHV